MDKKSKLQFNAQQTTAYYNSRSIGTLQSEGMQEQGTIVYHKKGNKLHDSFLKHPQVKNGKK